MHVRISLVRVLAVATIAVFSVAGSSAADRAADEQAIRAVVAQVVDAWNRNDLPAQSRDYAPTFDQVNLLGQLIEGREKFDRQFRDAAARGIVPQTGKKMQTIEKVKFLRPDVAVVISKTVDDNQSYRVTTVLTKEGERWMVEHRQLTPIRQPGGARAEKRP